MTKPETKRPHPAMHPDELTASEVGAYMKVARQSVLKRHERDPERMPGRLLPYHAGVPCSGRGIWVFPASAVADWVEERQRAKAKARTIARLKARGIDVYRSGSGR